MSIMRELRFGYRFPTENIAYYTSPMEAVSDVDF